MYDEDVVANNGAGAAYNEVVTSVASRQVNEVAVFGYSHGGGSTYSLATLLTTNAATIGTFSIVYTAYVDSVQNDTDTDTDQERRRPPGSGYHVNYYQVGTIDDYWLDGGPIITPPGANFQLNVETTAWGANATHFIIDEYTNVTNDVRNRLMSNVTR